jgi:membrane protein implicated in regulation of membrane protease activity
LVTILFLTAIAVGHLLRVLFAVPIVIASTSIPLWMSVAAFLFAGALAVLLWRDTQRQARERRSNRFAR